MNEPLTSELAAVPTNDRDSPGSSPSNQSVHVFPALQNNGTASPLSAEESAAQARVNEAEDEDDYNDEPAIAKPFIRTSSPDDAARNAATGADNSARYVGTSEERKTPDRLTYKMHKFTLYETVSRYYIVGVDVSEQWYRILKIDRTTEGEEPNMVDDKIVYSLREMNQLLDTIDDGNKGTGGLKCGVLHGVYWASSSLQGPTTCI